MSSAPYFTHEAIAAPWGAATGTPSVVMTMLAGRNSRNNQKPGLFLTFTFQVLCKWICLSELTLLLDFNCKVQDMQCFAFQPVSTGGYSERRVE